MNRLKTLAFALLLPSSLIAHNCGDSTVTIQVGQRATYRISADVEESEASHYELSINSDPSTVRVSPDHVDSLGFGEFVLEGLQPGTNSVVIEWAYAPTQASGFCVVQVIVVPPATAPRDVADHTTSGEVEDSGQSNDPVDTYTGEYTLQEAPDLDLGGPMPVRFSRYYASGLTRQPLLHSTVGRNWMHNYELRLTRSSTHIDVVYYEGRVIQFEQQQAGTWKLVGSPTTPYSLREDGGQFLLLDPQKNWVFHFEPSGNLVQIEDTRGNALALSYAEGQLSSVSDGLGRTLTFSYSGFQQLFSVSDGTRTVFFYHFGDNLATVVDASGASTLYSYDNEMPTGALLVSELLPDGNSPVTTTYDDHGRVSKQTRADGGVYTYSYSGLQTTITNADGKTQIHTHDAQGHLLKLVEEEGHQIASQFDSAGRRVGETTRSGTQISWEYQPETGHLSSIVVPGNLSLVFERSARDFRGFTIYDTSKITYLDHTTELFDYDASGNMIRFTDRAGRKSSFSYNEHGRMLAATNSAGGVVHFEYNSDQTLAAVSRMLPDGVHYDTAYFYDSLKRLDKTQYPDGKTVLIAYDKLDHVLSRTDEEGKITRYTYTANGFPSKITYPLGNALRLGYDDMNQLVSVTDDAGNSVVRTYDQMGRLSGITDRNGNIQRYEHDVLGQMTAYVDPAGHRWGRDYDMEGRIAAIIDPLGNSRSFQYNALSRVTSMSLPPEELRFTYDAMGRPVTMENPPGKSTLLTYEPDGATKSVTLPGAISSSWAYDSFGLPASIKDANGNEWRIERDALAREIAAIDPLQRATHFTMDGRDQVSAAAFPGQLGSISFAYNGRGQITSKSGSDGAAVTYAYDANGRLASATGVELSFNPQDDITGCNGLQIGRDAGGRMTSVTLAPGKVLTYAYDSRNLVTNITDWLGGATAFEYDAAGKLTSISRPNGVKTSYAYDGANRLTAIHETRPSSGLTLASIELTRDPGGLITRAKKDLPLQPALAPRAQTHSYDAASQLVGANYDAVGRLASDGSRTFDWDTLSRLKRFSDGQTPVTFQYDAFGDLRSRTEGAQTREYVWNLALNLRSPVVIRDAGADSLYLVHSPAGDLLYAIEASSGKRHYFHFDESGNTVFLTDDSGAVTDSYAYGPYGTLLEEQGSFLNPFTFAGRYSAVTESAAQLTYMRHRWLDLKNARFLTRDPNWGTSRNPNELNPYGYNRFNPLLYFDPLGLDARVNEAGVHTDISVDIWEGDQIIGTLTVSYAAKGYKGSFGGVSEAFWTVAGGTQGEFSVDFKRGSVQSTASPTALAQGTEIIIHGTREQDERLRKELARIIGTTDEYANERRGQIIIRQFIYQARFRKLQYKVIDATISDWETYRAISQSCNDFTDAMLDIYFGKNWYFGPIFQGEGLVDELKTYLKNQVPPGVDLSGIAPITGSTVVH